MTTALVSLAYAAIVAGWGGQAPMADTTAPPIPTGPFVFTYDTTRLVSTGSLYQRDVFTVAFRTGTPGVVIRAFFERFGAAIIGGAPRTGGYVVRIADPVTEAQWNAVGRAMGSDSNVAYAMPMMYRFGGAITVNHEGATPRRALQADTATPAIPDGIVFPTDTTVVIPVPGNTADVRYRNAFLIRFDPQTSGVTIRDVFSRYNASIIGGMPFIRAYLIQTPDPGPTWAAFDSLRTRLRAEPGVTLLYPLALRRPRPEPGGRWPVDGAQQHKAGRRPDS